MTSEHFSLLRSSACADGLPVYFLGCFERRVTIYSQQVRALELAHDLLESGAVRRETGRVAIVGGGIGGVTLAAMLAIASPRLRVSLFESQDQLLQLQRGARDRYVHPHIFDWPAEGTQNPDTGLPFMNWRAGPADEVVNTLSAQFEAARRHGSVDVRLKTPIEGLQPVGVDVCLVHKGMETDQTYDAVVLSVGFGYERMLSASNPSYWSPSLLPAPLLPPLPSREIFISGNGDGGLADFTLAAFNGKSHEQILLDILNHPGTARLVPILSAIEERAWAEPALDLFEAYAKELPSLLAPNLLREIHDALRRDVRIVFHTQEAFLFRAETALLNRLAVFLAIHVDRLYGRNAIQTIANVRLELDPSNGQQVTLGDGRRFTPHLRFLRLGPDKASLMQPFQAQRDGYLAARVGLPPARPADPAMSGRVREWADAAVRAAGLSAEDATAAPGGAPVEDAGRAEIPQNGTVQGIGNAINVVFGSVGAGATVNQTHTTR